MTSINQGLRVSNLKVFLLLPILRFNALSDALTGCPIRIVEFRTEELMKKAVEKVNKHNFNGRPLKVKEVGHMDKNYKVS